MSEENAKPSASGAAPGSPFIGPLKKRKPFGGSRRLYNVVRLRFKSSFISHTYDARLLDLNKSDHVIAETSKGPSLAVITSEVYREVLSKGSLKRVLRKATGQDLSRAEVNGRREAEAFAYAIDRLRHRRLDMKLIQVHCMHDGSKLIFYFSADGRIDFRELVKDLAHRFRTRIEMRQIGARDGARMIGGIGPCGRELCCSTFLESFAPVSIRMAKNQGLTLNPKKVSGMCGRLMCCLVYEQQIYHRARRRLPRAGRLVETVEGRGTIKSVDVVQEKVKVLLEEGPMEIFPVSEVVVLTPRDLEQRKAEEVRLEAEAQANEGQGQSKHFKDALRDVMTGEDQYLWEEPAGGGDKKGEEDEKRRRRKPRTEKAAAGERREGARSPSGRRGRAPAVGGRRPQGQGDAPGASGEEVIKGPSERRRRRGRRPPAAAGDKPAASEGEASKPSGSPEGGGGGDQPASKRRRRRRRGPPKPKE